MSGLQERHKDKSCMVRHLMTWLKKIPVVSKAAAYELYKNLANNAACNMTKEQLDEFEKKHPLNMAELRINSLFNRDVRGNWKFSHKSFFEYFLSEIAFDNWDAVPNIEKFDMGMQFYKQRSLMFFLVLIHLRGMLLMNSFIVILS